MRGSLRAAGSRRPSRPAARCALWSAGTPPVSGAGRRDLGSAGADDLSGLRRRGQRDRRGVAVSGRPSPGAPEGARFDIEVGHCSQCRRRIQGRHALQTSDALGAARAQLGPGVVALVVELHTHGGMPLAKVADLLQTRFGLHVTSGGLANLLHRAARDARPAYEALREQVRHSPVVTADETGWRVGALSHWLWAAVTPTTTVYAICAGCGFDDAQAVLGADFDGVLVRDGWVVYRRYTHGLSAAPAATF